MLISTLRLTGSHIRLAFVGISVTLAAMACGSVAVEPLHGAVGAKAAASDGPLVQQLAGEVSDARAMKHLQALQKIADETAATGPLGPPATTRASTTWSSAARHRVQGQHPNL